MISQRAIITCLGITQILAWGSTYYLPAVLADPIVRDTGWPLAWVVGGLSLGLLVSALISPHVGRLIDTQGGRLVLAFSAAIIGIGQICLALSPSLFYYILAWLFIGLGMGAGLYDAAFGTLGRLFGRDAGKAITALTLFGGFASTLCWPLSAYFVSQFGWRGTCLTYAGIQLFIALPLYLIVLPRPLSSPNEIIPVHAANTHRQPKPKRGKALFVLLAVTFTLSAVISTFLSVHLLMILQSGNIGLNEAVQLGALVGPSQVAARMIEMAIAKFHHPVWTKAASAIFVAFGITILWSSEPYLSIALVFYGAGIGLESIVRGVLPLTLYGADRYATVIGKLAMPSLLAQAATPWLGGLVLDHFGIIATLSWVMVVAFLNILLTLILSLIVFRSAA